MSLRDEADRAARHRFASITAALAASVGYMLDRRGEDGARYIRHDRRRTLIWSIEPHGGELWMHVSVAAQPASAPFPTWSEMERVKAAVIGDGYAYSVLPPEAMMVRQRSKAMHLYSPLDGAARLPEFSGEREGERVI